MSAKLSSKPLLLILLVALTLRLAAAFGLQYALDHRWNRTFLIEGDANGYWMLGEKIADGEPYSIYEPPRQVLRMPGFPLLVAASIQLNSILRLPDNRSYLVARVLAAIVGTAACGGVYLLGRLLVDPQIGYIAAALTAVMPTMIAFSAVLLSETLFAAALVASLVCMAALVRIDRGGSAVYRGVGWSVAVGLSIAVATYVRPTWLLAGPAFAVAYIVWSTAKRQAILRGTIVVATLLLALLPWAVRNHSVTGHWVLTTLWVGPSLYDALNPDATGESDMQFFERDRAKLAGMSEYEIDRYYREQAREFIRENPGRTLELTGIKFLRFWKPWPNAEQFSGWVQRLLVAAFFIPLAVFAIWGWWVAKSRFWLWSLAAGPIVYFAAVHSVFVGSLRYRLPAEYPLCILAAIGLRECLRRYRENPDHPPTSAAATP